MPLQSPRRLHRAGDLSRRVWGRFSPHVDHLSLHQGHHVCGPGDRSLGPFIRAMQNRFSTFLSHGLVYLRSGCARAGNPGFTYAKRRLPILPISPLCRSPGGLSCPLGGVLWVPCKCWSTPGLADRASAWSFYGSPPPSNRGGNFLYPPCFKSI